MVSGNQNNLFERRNFMNYFDSKITIEIVSLDDTNIQKEL